MERGCRKKVTVSKRDEVLCLFILQHDIKKGYRKLAQMHTYFGKPLLNISLTSEKIRTL